MVPIMLVRLLLKLKAMPLREVCPLMRRVLVTIYKNDSQKKKIMGFGHREYKNGDSRVPSMKEVARKVAAAADQGHWVDVGQVVEDTMMREKGIFPNVDLPCAYTYYMMDIPIPLYTPIFVSSRVAGWAAHVIEQHDNNRLIRPNHNYRSA